MVWRDVTEHARMDEELRLQSTVLRRAAEGVCLIRASDGVIVYANHRFAEIMGYEHGELDGRPVAEINWEDEPGQAELVAEQISADLERFGEARFELRNQRKDGSLIWCEAHVVAFDHPDHGRVWVSVQQDVTSQREARTRSSRRQRRRLAARGGSARAARWPNGQPPAWSSAWCAGETSSRWSAAPGPVAEAGGCFFGCGDCGTWHETFADDDAVAALRQGDRAEPPRPWRMRSGALTSSAWARRSRCSVRRSSVDLIDPDDF